MNVERWGWYSVGLNVLLAALHAAIAAASGSLAVAAELVHNMMDFASAVAVLAGLKNGSLKLRRGNRRAARAASAARPSRFRT